MDQETRLVLLGHVGRCKKVHCSLVLTLRSLIRENLVGFLPNRFPENDLEAYDILFTVVSVCVVD